MQNTSINHVNVLGIATVIPDQEGKNLENTNFAIEEVSKIVASTGVETRYVTDVNVCTSDLCYAAANQLLEKMKVDRQEIDVIIFISQTPDYVLPATACALQNRLHLKKEVVAFDINLGCSGYTYGLMVVANLLSSGRFKKALLLAGDTISKVVSPEDRSVAFLFGDAGTATLLAYDENAVPMYVDFGTDGSGADKLVIPAGGCRFPTTPDLLKRNIAESGNSRAQTDLFMNGADIFSFTLREVPKTIRQCLEKATLGIGEVDFFIFHQANLFMLNHLIKKMQLPAEKVPLSLTKYGNTSVASIPLTLCQEYLKFALPYAKKLLLCGFGVGFSWASVALTLNGAVILPIIKYSEVSHELN